MWIDYFRGAVTPQSSHLHELLGSKYLLTGERIVTEALHGFRHDRDANLALRLLTSFDVIHLAGKDPFARYLGLKIATP